MGGLVQQPAAPGAHRQYPAGRGRGTLFRGPGQPATHGMTQTKQSPGNSGRFDADTESMIDLQSYGHQMRHYFSGLQANLTNSFNQAIADYSVLRPHIDALAKQNAAYRGPLIEGSVSVITNRYEGLKALYRSPSAFYQSASSGLLWASYFASAKNLADDVQKAGASAVISHIRAPSFDGVAKILWTQIDLARGGAQELEAQVRTRYEQQRNALVVSTGVGIGVTQLLKKAGSLVHNDIQRLGVRIAQRTWQGTGLLALCYGLSRLNSSVEGSGVFASELRKSRDQSRILDVPTGPTLKLEDAIKDLSYRPY